jgi:hypothetical protein
VAQRFEREPAYVVDRHAAVDALGLHYAFAVCCAAIFVAASSFVGAGPDPDRPPAPSVAAASGASADLYGLLACESGSRQPSS